MTANALDLPALARQIRDARGVAHKRDIDDVVRRLGLGSRSEAVPVGDDCAAIPDGDGYLLLAIEGFLDSFVAADPYFAGYCGIMVNLSDVAAMGGRPLAVVDALWSRDAAAADPILDGLRDAAALYGVPVVGGHTNTRASAGNLAVAVLGRAGPRLLTSFDARPGDDLVAAIDLRGRFRDPYPYWDASTGAPGARLRGDLDLLPGFAEDGLCAAAKDISMAGVVGTALMLLECSDVGAVIDLDAIPRPDGIALERWLTAFPSFGYLLSVRPDRTPAVLARFAEREIAAAAIGRLDASKVARGSRDLRRGRGGLGFPVQPADRLPPYGGPAVKRFRVAILTHSTNPRGGVVHALALAEALCELGHEAVVHAPDPSRRGFFRDAVCPTVSVDAEPVAGDTVDLVRARIDDYLRHFARPAARDFDVFHAHCGIGGAALATLTQRRLILGFVRTVHHLDSFFDPQLAHWQDRSIAEATRLLCVSRTWADDLQSAYGTRPAVVGNGVDLSIYSPETFGPGRGTATALGPRPGTDCAQRRRL